MLANVAAGADRTHDLCSTEKHKKAIKERSNIKSESLFRRAIELSAG